MPKQTSVIVVHGTGGSSEGNWFPWIKRELTAVGCTILVPSFPTPEGQSFDAWHNVFDGINTYQPQHTILIGHSIGASFVLRLAEETSVPYKALFAVCPFSKKLGIKEFDALNATFVDYPFNWSRIKMGAKHRLCFAGDNDPYVPLPYSAFIAEQIDAPLKVVQKGGHLNAESGHLSFPELLESVKTVL